MPAASTAPMHRWAASLSAHAAYGRCGCSALPGALLLMLLGAGIPVIYSSCLAMAAAALAMLWQRPDLIAPALLGGCISAATYFMLCLAAGALMPGIFRNIWHTEKFLHIFIAGVPLEELLYGFLFGLCCHGLLSIRIRQAFHVSHSTRGCMHKIKAWLQASRLPSQSYIFFPLLLGQALRYAQTGQFDWTVFLLLHLYGLFLQLFIVYANDRADIETDRLNTTFTIFSGGSRTLVNGLITVRENYAAVLTVIVLNAAVGLALTALYQRGLALPLIAAVARAFVAVQLPARAPVLPRRRRTAANAGRGRGPACIRLLRAGRHA